MGCKRGPCGAVVWERPGRPGPLSPSGSGERPGREGPVSGPGERPGRLVMGCKRGPCGAVFGDLPGRLGPVPPSGPEERPGGGGSVSGPNERPGTLVMGCKRGPCGVEVGDLPDRPGPVPPSGTGEHTGRGGPVSRPRERPGRFGLRSEPGERPGAEMEEGPARLGPGTVAGRGGVSLTGDGGVWAGARCTLPVTRTGMRDVSADLMLAGGGWMSEERGMINGFCWRSVASVYTNRTKSSLDTVFNCFPMAHED